MPEDAGTDIGNTPWWKTLPAILGGAASVITAIGVLIAQFNAPVKSGPSTPSRGGTQYAALNTNDGFVVIRAGPSVSHSEVGRLKPGEIIVCTDVVKGEKLDNGDEWANCPNRNGYVYFTLLKPAN
jgi:hypothetical protein